MDVLRRLKLLDTLAALTFLLFQLVRSFKPKKYISKKSVQSLNLNAGPFQDLNLKCR